MSKFFLTLALANLACAALTGAVANLAAGLLCVGFSVKHRQTTTSK